LSGPLSNPFMFKSSAAAGDFHEYQIANSCRFDRASSHYLNRTIQAGGNLDLWTLSFWMKLTASAGFGSNQYHVYTSEDNTIGAYDAIMFDVNSSSQIYYQISNKYFTGNHSIRDTSAWYHVVIVFDSENGTAAHRKRVWFNNVEDTGSDVQTYTQNLDSQLNKNTVHNIGARQDENASYFFDGYLADFIFVDGYAYAPTYFGESKNGCWIPKDYKTDTGNYGTTGYHLDFADSSALGNDVSGNNNDWTANNLSAHDQMLDSPTFNSSSNGGNFATWNPLNAGSYTTLSEGNLQVTGTSSDASQPSGTFAMTSGKWYYEMLIKDYVSGYPYPGLAVLGNIANSPTTGGDIWAMRYRLDNGTVGANSGDAITGLGTITATSTGVTTATDGDIISWYLDCDNRKAWIAKNGTIPNSGDPANGTNPQWSWTATPNNGITFTAQIYNGDDTILNAGQDGTFAGEKTAQGNSDDTGYGNFYYDPPTGFLAMCTGNLSVADEVDPAQTDDDYPQKLFDAKLYTGTGSTNALTGLGFQPDWVWIKERGGANNHMVFDSTRGTSKYISANTNGDQGTDSATMNTFGSDGFTVGSDGKVNASSDTYVAWNWRANGGTTSSNTTGDITSTVQVDPSGSFSIVKYTGESATKTVGHGLSAAPYMMIIKALNNTYNWAVYHTDIGLNALFLNTTGAEDTGAATLWGNAHPTASVFSVGDGNETGKSVDYIAYCFANCEGYIKAGTYEGNADNDGAFVYTGFKPAWMLLKEVAVDNWGIYDNKRDGRNNDDGDGNAVLYADDDYDEENQASRAIDLLSNGFKLRTSNATFNASNTYVFLAMAHNPFKYATGQ